jgi:biopolymer transport protein ExbB
VEATGRQEIRTLERHIDWLATIAGAAPLLGFLGTVTGMVKAFQVIEKMGGPVNPSMLAAGIWEALITTVFGLSIAIPCVFAYNYFVNRIENIVLDVEAATNDLIDSFAND